jgi:hypothetical protein
MAAILRDLCRRVGRYMMHLLPLDRLGARQNGRGIDLGVLLPAIS